MPPKVSIITRVYNNKQITKECIESIKRNTINIDYEHIIIDNGSTDDTSGYLQNLSDIILIKNPKNYGCAISLNQGVSKSCGKYICNVDNDVIVSKNWLLPMVEFAEKNKNIGIVSPGTREGDFNYDMDKYAEDFTKRMKNVKDDGFGGWCMLIKKEVIDKIGLFSEEFNMYCEDTDFYYRMESAGFKAITIGSSFVHHRVNATLSKIPGKKIFEQEHILKLRKKWNINEDVYFKRKAKSFLKFIKNSYYKILNGHTLLEKAKK
jgi:GT2 family glycosyltransferase